MPAKVLKFEPRPKKLPPKKPEEEKPSADPFDVAAALAGAAIAALVLGVSLALSKIWE